MSSRCPDCGLVLPNAHEKKGCAYLRLRAVLQKAVTPWTETDDRMTRWLAGWDEPTMEWVVSLVRRALAAATEPSERP